MSLLTKVKGTKIHNRGIEITTYDAGDLQILVEGRLQDKRLVETHHFSGETLAPQTYHHMILRLLVKGPVLTIEDLEVEMPTAPREACIETLAMMEPVKGMRISSGFTSRVKELVGGPRGCAHVVSLLLTMAPAAVQGFWSHLAQDPAKTKALAPRLSQYLIDTCWVWRQDSPDLKHYRQELNRHTDTQT